MGCYCLGMNWTEVLTIIGTLAVVFIALQKAFEKTVDTKFEKIEQSQNHIKELLSNHITETKDEIKNLNSEMKEVKVVLAEIKAALKK